jgi:formate dehydrogenase alpha subunit
MVTLTIDGVKVSVERGTSILEAAQKAGIRIPTLCHDKRLIPYGACRLCVVEVTQRGRTKTMPSCFNPAKDGMEVATRTSALDESRRMELQFLLRSHPLLCPNCDAAGDCQLQNLAHEYKLDNAPFPRESRYYHVDNDSHFIRHNMNLCVRCGMCVRICDEVQGQNEISFINRGILCEVSTDFGRPLDCEFCGQCAAVCPTGAIRSKWLVGTGRDFELTRSNTTCSFCSLGCTLTLGCKDQNVVYVTSPSTSPNEGSLCVKGRYGWPYVYSEQRLTKPSVRKSGALGEVEWDEAISFVADKLAKIKAEHGPGSIAALGSERLTNEEAYVFNRLVKGVINTPNIDHAGGFGYRALVDGLQPSLGYAAGANSIREIRKANVILLVGADLTETHPVAKNEVILATGRNRAKAIVVDSIQGKLTERTGLFLGIKPGTEHIALNGMLKVIIDSELYDKTFVDQKTSGFDDLKASLSPYDLAKVTELTGVSADLIETAAKEYASAPLATIILTQGMNKLGANVETAQAAANLALITGHIGKEACGIHVFGEKANFQGAIDMGLAPDLLPGCKSLEDADARAKVEAAWGSAIPREKGLSAAEILQKAESGEIKALYIVGENPIETYPDRAQVERALAKLDLLVVQDMFPTPTAQVAHAVLPVKSFAEKSGTFTSAERLVQLINPILKSVAGKSDLEIFSLVAGKLGASFNYSGPEHVMEEISTLVDEYKGISHKRLSQAGLQWPCLDAEDAGKPVLYQGSFPGGKAKLISAAPIKAAKSSDLPMFLIPETLKFHSGSFSTWSPSMMEVCPTGALEMNEKDLKALGLKDGDSVRVTLENGAGVTAAVKRSRRAIGGSILAPGHFAALKLNSLTKWNEPVIKVKVEKIA